MDCLSAGIGEGSRDVDAAISCLVLRSCRIGGVRDAVHDNAIRQRWIYGAHQGGRSGDHCGRARSAAPRHVTVILVGSQDVHTGCGHKNRTAVVACRGEVVILIGGGNADDALVAGREGRGAAALVACGGNQNNVLLPSVVNGVLQALAETRIAESHPRPTRLPQ